MPLQPQSVTLDTEWIIRVKDYTNPFTKFFLLLNKIKNLIDIEIEIIRKPSNGCSSDLNQNKKKRGKMLQPSVSPCCHLRLLNEWLPDSLSVCLFVYLSLGLIFNALTVTMT